MKGVRFYLEYPNAKEKRNGTRENPGNHSGVVVALFHEEDGLNYSRESGVIYAGMAGIFDRPNSPVATSNISQAFLEERCKRISEELAREIHPALFERLD